MAFLLLLPRGSRGLSLIGLLLVTGLAGSVFGRPCRAADEPATKRVAPEFDGNDVMGLTDRQRTKTDCSITWTRNDKVYCFLTNEAKAAFLKAPEDNLLQATDMFAAGDIKDVGKAMEAFEAGDAQTFIEMSIKATADKNGGIFVVDDPVTSTSLPLVYDKVDFTRTLKGYGFFPDVNFHDSRDPRKTYLVDFWLVPRDGKLTVLETRLYKTPVKDGDRWVMMQRQPKPWWWIPAAEHPGETEQKRSWEVMSSIEHYIVGQTAVHDGVLTLKDDKTGEDIPLQFMDVHQPVRRLKADGRYFACTDFRKQGTTDQFYDIDFWLDDKTGKIAVSNVRVHKVPFRTGDGEYVQIPRYNFDSNTFDQVP